MARNTASLEAKALAETNKSAGMRMLLEAGQSVSEVAATFEAPYGFVYGVARRAGLIESTPRETTASAPARRPAEKAARPAARATKAAAGKTTARAAARPVRAAAKSTKSTKTTARAKR